jgi:hypothetical protein
MNQLEAINCLSNLELKELDKAIHSLRRARISRAEYIACVALKPGQQVQFTHSSTYGPVILSGRFEKPYVDPGKIEVINVREIPGINLTQGGTYIVDASDLIMASAAR